MKELEKDIEFLKDETNTLELLLTEFVHRENLSRIRTEIFDMVENEIQIHNIKTKFRDALHTVRTYEIFQKFYDMIYQNTYDDFVELNMEYVVKK